MDDIMLNFFLDSLRFFLILLSFPFSIFVNFGNPNSNIGSGIVETLPNRKIKDWSSHASGHAMCYFKNKKKKRNYKFTTQ